MIDGQNPLVRHHNKNGETMNRLSLRCAMIFVTVFIAASSVRAQTVETGTVSAPPKLAAPAPTSALPAELPSRLNQALASHTLRVCMTGDYKPYSFLRPDGQFEGIDIDLVESFAKSLGARVLYEKTTWSNLMNEFTAKCDIAVGGRVDHARAAKTRVLHRAVHGGWQDADRALRGQGQVSDGRAIDQPSVRTIVNPGGTNERFAKQFFPHSPMVRSQARAASECGCMRPKPCVMSCASIISTRPPFAF